MSPQSHQTCSNRGNCPVGLPVDGHEAIPYFITPDTPPTWTFSLAELPLSDHDAIPSTNHTRTPSPFPSSICKEHAHYFSPSPAWWGAPAPLAAPILISHNYMPPAPAYPELSFDEGGPVDWVRVRYAANWRDLKFALGRDLGRTALYRSSRSRGVVGWEEEGTEEVSSQAGSPFVVDLGGTGGVEGAGFIVLEDDGEEEGVSVTTIELNDSSDADSDADTDTDTDSTSTSTSTEENCTSLNDLLSAISLSRTHQPQNTTSPPTNSLPNAPNSLALADHQHYHHPSRNPPPSISPTAPPPWPLPFSYLIATEFCLFYDAASEAGGDTWLETPPATSSLSTSPSAAFSSAASRSGAREKHAHVVFADLSRATQGGAGRGWFRGIVGRVKGRAARVLRRARRGGGGRG